MTTFITIAVRTSNPMTLAVFKAPNGTGTQPFYLKVVKRSAPQVFTVIAIGPMHVVQRTSWNETIITKL
jgi:hypothetical protein